ncbi:AAEL015254-PA [Aedes aegypti]|uniref:AAEL015254-PA n=2 Tax=Aedes aegypti TaxID=7159 RepID=A0A1S4G3V5_AEDAE|nr:peritrophin-48 [Aedes aegypti]EAT32463.1 AAEL015254-PA [Aedes aegypti]
MMPAICLYFGLLLILTSSSVSSFSSRNHYALLRADNGTDTDTFYDSSPLCGTGPLTICIGCQTYKLCSGQPTDDTDSKVRCPVDRPYCESTTGMCSENPDNSIIQCSSGSPDNGTTPETPAFKCTGEGKFPDPLSCGKFYYCSGPGVDGVPTDCPPNYSYNVTSQKCEQTTDACQMIDCSSDYVFNEHPADSQYFYYCKQSAASSLSEIFLFSCGSGAKFDVCSEQCVFKCSSEGLFAKASNPNKYYQCYNDNGTLKFVERSCPVESQIFDEMVQFCIYPVTN